jgi:uncharacterized protein (TIGR03084 family)
VPDLASLCADLAAEHAVLDALVADLDRVQWLLPTPAVGWTIRDQIAHLAFADERAALAVRDPDAFAAQRDVDHGDANEFARRMAGGDRAHAEPADVLAHWREARNAFLLAVEKIDPKTRIPWYGPPMSPASKISARLMETWAHGYDVADTVGVIPTPTARLRHVAHIGVGARRYSYVARRREPDDTPVAVVLRAPDGDEWSWGDTTAGERVSGDALDFCLVVTRRRHIADTALVVRGPAAVEWMSICQAYAGPPGAGRRPGSHRRSG